MHWVGFVLHVTVDHVKEDGGVEGVVEDGVGRETAWVIWLLDAIFSDGRQRCAVAVVDVVGGYGFSGQLICVEGLGVPSVILIEVCESIVEEDGGRHVRWNRE